MMKADQKADLSNIQHNCKMKMNGFSHIPNPIPKVIFTSSKECIMYTEVIQFEPGEGHSG